VLGAEGFPVLDVLDKLDNEETDDVGESKGTEIADCFMV
jgi:hypothetical protein